MKGALAVGLALVLAVAGLAAGYAVGSANTHTTTTISRTTSTVTVTNSTRPWTVVVQNATFTGPGCQTSPELVFMALRIPCLNYTNSTTLHASLLQYNGKDFYSANESVISKVSGALVTYTVWFDNSSAYCASPFLAVSELPTCPPP